MFTNGRHKRGMGQPRDPPGHLLTYLLRNHILSISNVLNRGFDRYDTARVSRLLCWSTDFLSSRGLYLESFRRRWQSCKGVNRLNAYYLSVERAFQPITRYDNLVYVV